MNNKIKRTRFMHLIGAAGLSLILAACASQPYQTERDKTKRGAVIGALAGVAVNVARGARDADDILIGGAVGAGVGAGVGAYMDKQEEQIARIPGTSTERIDEETLLVRFESDILFEVDSAALSSSATSSLSEFSNTITEFDKTAVVIQGHTDSTGSDSYNQALSERRADSVFNFLARQGVDPARMRAVGYGESTPIASNETEAGRQQNRRVTVLLKAKA